MTRLLAARRGAAPPLPACRDTRARFTTAPFLYLALIGLALGSVPARAQSRVIAAVDSSVRPERESGVLARLVTVHFDDMPLGLALHLIAHEGNLRLSYSSDVVPVARRISVSRDRTPVGEVLRDALENTNVDPVVTPSGYVVLVKNPQTLLAPPGPTAPELTVTDRTPIRPQIMDRVLVMGTPATGAPERELPSAVTVLTASHIAAYGPSSMQDLLRSGIPGIVAWDLGISGPFAQIGSVRGSSSFTSNYLKTYVDGVELDAIPQGHLLFVKNDDTPGVVGHLGSLLGRRAINIARMSVGRRPDSGRAVMVIEVDNEVPPDVVNEVLAIPGVRGASAVRLG